MNFDENMIWKENGQNKWHYSSDFVNYLKEIFNSPVNFGDVAKEIHMDRRALERILNENSIKILPLSNSPKFKAIYQDFDWCYTKYIIEGLNHEEMAKEANCSKRVIEKWCYEKHNLTQKFRQECKILNSIQRDLIIGSMLGDGHIDKREEQPIFIVVHAENQKDYLYWKYDILKDMCNISPTYKEASYKPFGDKEYFCQASYRLCTRIHNSLLPYRSMSNKDLLSKMNEFSLAIWILDDGYRSDSNWELCVAEYTDTDIEYIIKILKDKFNLHIKSKKDKRYMGLDANSSRKLDKIILKNIPNNLDIIKYKILDRNIKQEHINYRVVQDGATKIGLAMFCRINKLPYIKSCVFYDKGMHNGNELRKVWEG